jgi:hypothetical protein
VVAQPTTTTTTYNASVVQACEADARTFETAAETYKSEVGVWPPAGNGAVMTRPSAIAVDNGPVGPFLRQLPSTLHYTIWTDGDGGVYVYPPSQRTKPTTFRAVYNFDTGTPCTLFHLFDQFVPKRS